MPLTSCRRDCCLSVDFCCLIKLFQVMYSCFFCSLMDGYFWQAGQTEMEILVVVLLLGQITTQKGGGLGKLYT